MAVMTPDDWANYRQQAAQQSTNVNALPYVFDPAKATADPAANQQTLYGNASNPTGAAGGGTNPNTLRQAVGAAFQQFYGRAPTEQDYSAWVAGAQQNGLSPQAVMDAIAASANDPRNAGMAANKSTGQAAFTGGLMSGGGGNALSGGGFSGLTGGYG